MLPKNLQLHHGDTMFVPVPTVCAKKDLLFSVNVCIFEALFSLSKKRFLGDFYGKEMQPLRPTGPDRKLDSSKRSAQTHGRCRPEDYGHHPSEVSRKLAERPGCDQWNAPTDQSVHPMSALREGKQSLITEGTDLY